MAVARAAEPEQAVASMVALAEEPKREAAMVESAVPPAADMQVRVAAMIVTATGRVV